MARERSWAFSFCPPIIRFMTTSVADLEFRCPVGARRLFMIMRQRGERPSMVQPDNLMEFSCYDCRHHMERHSGRRVKRVLHRYDLAGTLVETLVVE